MAVSILPETKAPPQAETPDRQHSTRAAILDFVIRYKTDNDGIAPSMREIAAAVDLAASSLSTVKLHLSILERDGFVGVIRDGSGNSVPRGIQVRGGGYRFDGRTAQAMVARVGRGECAA
jgi:SOS-response transcriptional repressor LexA